MSEQERERNRDVFSSKTTIRIIRGSKKKKKSLSGLSLSNNKRQQQKQPETTTKGCKIKMRAKIGEQLGQLC